MRCSVFEQCSSRSGFDELEAVKNIEAALEVVRPYGSGDRTVTSFRVSCPVHALLNQRTAEPPAERAKRMWGGVISE